ncbi:MAG: bifunctional helix-turn-helix domain-containing protein/methylated-DNA--[protein]-cysteine S-methyltransferase [Steroidobacteraceae bacterium]|nr:bifunctional helix-turn-helix domain-containing protein/methylated-DNA--[protein]-cysteine S-methyltransferase [Steroidobacteraceae bacterium]
MHDHDPTYARMSRAIEFIDRHFAERPDLAAMAAAAGLSESHFSREFRRWAGLAPTQYMNQLALAAAKADLGAQGTALTAACVAGLSGGGRLHDLFVTLEAVTPGEYKSGGAGVDMQAGFAETPFGTALLASSARGLSHLSFVDDGDEAALEVLAGQWPRARWHRDDAGAARLARQVFETGGGELRLWVRGTNFQVQVWRALLDLAALGPTTYSGIAQAIGRPGASRAVGTAVGDNPVAWLIPCHRVLRSDGGLGGYRWGLARKRDILAWEVARAAVSAGAAAA